MKKSKKQAKRCFLRRGMDYMSTVHVDVSKKQIFPKYLTVTVMVCTVHSLDHTLAALSSFNQSQLLLAVRETAS